MKRFAAVLAALLGVLLAPGVAAAQPPLEVRSVTPADDGTLLVTVAVPPALAGGEVSSAAFTVSVGGEVVELSSADQLPAPVDVILVVDTSGSMRGDPIAALKAAASQFIAQLGPNLRVAVVEFDTTPRVLAPVSEDRAAALAAVQGLDAGGNTALWDALITAADLVQDRPAYVVALSDGEDNASGADREAAVAALAGAGAPLYALSLDTDVADRAALADVVDRVGGELFAAEDPAALAAMYDQVGSRLSNLWQLRFTPSHTSPQPLVVALAGVDEAAPAVEVAPTTSAAAPTEAALRVPTVDGWARHGLWLGPALLLAAAGFGWALVVRRDVPRLQLSAVTDDGGLRGRLVDVADRAIPASSRSSLDRALEAADANLRPGELVVGVSGAALLMSLAGWAFLGIGGLALGVAAPLVARLEVSRRAKRRRTRFAEQLPDTLALLASSLRVGKAVPQALELVASDAPEPTAAEFRRVMIEARIGRDLVDALSRVSERTDSEDFAWVARAVEINRELGGDLAEVLDNVAETIRDRAQIARQVRSLSAEGRLSAWVLMGLPVGVAVLVSRLNPGYLDPLFTETTGRFLVGGGLAMFAIGGLWVRRVVNLQY
jgi:tight adherence protein B